MTSVCVNPKLPIELVNHIIDFIPQPVLKKSQEFIPGLYKIITQLEKSEGKFIMKSNVLIPLVNHKGNKEIIETSKQFKIVKDGYTLSFKRYNNTGYEKRKNQILKKSDFVETPTYKYYPSESIVWIEKETDTVGFNILPWRDYYENELNELRFHI